MKSTINTSNNKPSVNPPSWLLVVGLFAAAWNGIGVVAFVSEILQTPEQIAQLTSAQQALITAKPAWVTLAFATAVFSGLLGSILLILKNRLALPLFALSLFGLIGQNTYFFIIAKVQNTMASSNFIMPFIVFIIAIVLFLFSRSCINKGWLR